MSDETIVEGWTTSGNDYVEVYSNGHEFRWRVKNIGNHENVGSGEGHTTLEAAVAAAERHHPPVPSEK